MITRLQVARFRNNPLITTESSQRIGNNINGPSVIRVPDWVKAPLGAYYMYFAHHGGDHIRLAYADDPRGPWTVHEPGTLQLADVDELGLVTHIASPDVHVDEEHQRFRMYFHGCKPGAGQVSAVALSTDGLDFKPTADILGPFYFRVFAWQDNFYAVAKLGNSGFGQLLQSPDGLQPFEPRRQVLPMMRHAAVCRRNDRLLVFYSRKGDAPERILLSVVQLAADPTDWAFSEPIDVLAPDTDYEGIEYPKEPSEYGGAANVRQLRDPAVLETGGKTYLYYSIAGEMGIAGAEVKVDLS